ncbi:M3 family oligoendopeptidase [soil metagenome]
MTTTNALPEWDLKSEYPSNTSAEFVADLALIEASQLKIAKAVDQFRADLQKNPVEQKSLIQNLQSIAEIEDEAFTVFHNLRNFVSCECSVDASNQVAQKKLFELEAFGSKLNQTVTAVSLYLARASDEVITAYLDHPITNARGFSLRLSRLNQATLLPESEENLVSALALSGPRAWGNLYNDISGRLKCDVALGSGTEMMGLAKASGLMKGSDEPTRKAAWDGINGAWSEHKESAAAILNSLAGWRIEIANRRSHTKKIDFLTMPLRQSMIERDTLEAMLSAVRDHRPTAQKALRNMAKGMGKARLDPWDMLAAAPEPKNKPNQTGRSFEEGFEMIRESFLRVDPEFGAFCDIMRSKNWIEARVLPNKRNGAFCTGFAKSRTPRVFQTYLGSLNDIRTLAHELGHAYHSWVQRDLPRYHRDSPMTLAESASVFAETAFADYMLSTGDATAKAEINWQNDETAAAFLLNIPVRYEFEKSFYTKRMKSTLTADELSETMTEAWMNWYGDTVSAADPMFWASKLHFSISSVSFYNFPYTFGYLFSRGLYARRKSEGPSFMKAYVNILRDTGRMTAEELIQNHLGEDIRKVDYWKRALEV